MARSNTLISWKACLEKETKISCDLQIGISIWITINHIMPCERP